MTFEMPAGAIAIVGMSGRFPGAPNLGQFWKNLRDGIRGITVVEEGNRPRNAQSPNYVPAAAVLPDPDFFDAAFFNISRREAEILDPQRRVFLECAWEALENAGIDPFVYDAAIGVFAGATASTYLPTRVDTNHLARDFEFLISNDKDYIASYVGYKLNLRGPCVAIQTACSTSLVAVHIACASLLAHECDVALSGGVTVRLPQGLGYIYEEGFILSPDGHCRTFDANARGTVVGNGVGVVVLKRLEDAIADGDPIRAIIRGSAINNDGSTKVGFTAPSVIGQLQVITEALAIADVEPNTIQYIEAHGTATALGDAIEVAALKQAFGTSFVRKRSIALGALKASVGHTDSAAGVGGLIKTVLAMEHRQIPAHPGFEKPNPDLGLDESPFYVSRDAHDWNTKDGPRRAGVSSFGIGGTNAHVIVEEAPPNEWADPAFEGMPVLLPLSAKSPAALMEMAQRYSHFFNTTKTNLSDIIFTASTRRRHHEHRLAVVGTNKKELADALESFASGKNPPSVVTGKTGIGDPKVVFVFPGQGSQWVGMGRQLYREEPVFRDALAMCDEAIRKESGFSVIEELDKPEGTSRLSDIDVVQPVLFAIEAALAALWRSWGVEPAAVVGHSMGEVAAAFVAGALFIGDAAAIICRRSRLLRKVAGQGAMALVELTLPNAEKALLGYEGRLSVAVSNGPRSTVIAGDPEVVEEVLSKLEQEGVFCRRIKVDVASHSPQMDPLRDELLTALVRLSPKTASIPMHSTVTGEPLRGDELAGTYWADNVRKPVLFSHVVEQWIRDGHTIFVELSPHPILAPSVEENLHALNTDGVALASTRRTQDERQSMLSSLGALFVRGVPVAWKAFFPEGGRVIELPTYPWQRERYWMDAPIAETSSFPTRTVKASKQPLLGVPFSSAIHSDARFWQQSISRLTIPWLAEHQVQGEIVFPGAGYVECILEAGMEVFGQGPLFLDDVSFDRMMAIADDTERDVQVICLKTELRSSVQIASRGKDDSAWTIHAGGFIQSGNNESRPVIETPMHIAARLSNVLDVPAFYQQARARDTYHGPSFQGMVDLRASDTDALARVCLHDSVDASGYVFHPALLDACLQAAAVFVSASSTTDTYVLRGIEQMRVYARPVREMWVLATLRESGRGGPDLPVCDLRMMDEHGHVFVDVDGLQWHKLEQIAGRTHDPFEDCRYEIAWRPVESLPDPSWPANGTWVVFADRSGMGDILANRLSKLEQRCVRVLEGSSYERVDADLIRIDVSNRDHYQRLFRDLFGDEGHCAGVIHLASLDAAPFDQTTIESLTADLTHASLTAVFVVQAIVRHGFHEVPPLVLVTRGAQSVLPNDPVSVAQAPILGLGKTITMEHPEIECVRVDLSPSVSEQDVELLLRELGSKQREDQIAFRGTTRFVARLVCGALDDPGTTSLGIRADRSYLITGGLGGLGFSLAKWLVEQGARHLVLVGRNVPNEETSAAIRMLEETGARVAVVQADVSRENEVERLFATIRKDFPPLCGVVHAAVVLEDRSLLEQSAASFHKVFAPKGFGAWNLHKACDAETLDFFIMYSSGSSLIGSPGQANYCTSNAYLDALCRERHRLGLPGMSIQWGAFSDVGSAAAQDIRGKRLTYRGVASFSPAEGLEALRRLLLNPRAEVGVVRFHFRQWMTFYPNVAGIPFFADVMKQAAVSTNRSGTGQTLDILQAALASDRRELLERHLMEQVGAVLRLDWTQMDRAAPFQSLGLDSLMSLELRNRLEASLGLRLSATVLFTYSTAVRLGQHLLQRLGLVLPLNQDVKAEPDFDNLQELQSKFDDLSDEEIIRMGEDLLA